MKAAAKFAALMILLVLACPSYPDGVVISPTAYAKVEVPDQSAMIAYDGTTERLLIETSFIGSGTNFAWIVPVPATPEVAAGTTGMIPTLQIVFRPEVRHNVPHLYGAVMAIGALLFLIATVRPDNHHTVSDVLACAALSLGIAVSLSGMMGLVCLLSILAVREARRGSSLIVGIGCVFAIAMILGSLMLPALGTSGAAVASNDQVRVHERKIVGQYETATVSSPDGSALLIWLAGQGFPVATNILPVVKEYASEGWSFVAVRIRRDQDTANATVPHPLVFSFKTAKPVYPMRLTGAGHESCRVDLYVFGPGRAEIPGYQVERCDMLDTMRLRHAQILKLAANTSVATKLSARLRAEDMRLDGWISWTPFKAKRPLVFSQKGAGIMAANMVLILLGVFLGAMWLMKKNLAGRRYFQVGAAAMCLFAGIYLALPKVPASIVHSPIMRADMYHHSAIYHLSKAWEKASETAETAKEPSLQWLRDQMKTVPDGKYHNESMKNNPFNGLSYREEDSPGNYIFRKTPTGWDYVWFNLDGSEKVRGLFE